MPTVTADRGAPAPGPGQPCGQRDQVLARRGPVIVRIEAEARPYAFPSATRESASRPPSMSAIFDKFYRLDPDLTRGVGGTGLGLYICRELVRRMYGRISLVSSPGDGSTFVVDLPAASSLGHLLAAARIRASAFPQPL